MAFAAWDIETLKACFCVVIHDTDGNKFEYCKSNDELVEPKKISLLLDALTKYDMHTTYNGKNFDIRVLAWIASQKQPISVQEISDQASLLIADQNDHSGKNLKTSKCWNVKTECYRKNHFDTLHNFTGTHSLKWWELAKGWSVKETDVPWDKPFMTKSEIEGTLFYCHHDVDATLKLFMQKECQDLISARKWLLDQCEVPALPDLPMAALSETYTYGNFKGDEEGTCEELIDWYSYDIPTNVLDMFMAIARGDINGFVWNSGAKKVIVVDSEEYKACLKTDKNYFEKGWAAYGKGGAHYAKAGLNKGTKIFDVASLYPSIIQHHLPLKCKKAQKRYVDGKLERIRIKRLKGTPEYSKAVDMGLKLNLNSLSGKFRQKGAVAYAPNHGLAMCILGQLLITEATWNAIGKDPTRWDDVIEINTDSFAVIGDDNIERARKYVEWCLPNHKFEFEEEDFPISYWKDVNHYVVYNEDGSIKETHGDFEMASELVIMESIYDMGKNIENIDEPYLVDDKEFWTKDRRKRYGYSADQEINPLTPYLVKFTKTASSKNCKFAGNQIEKKYCYFLYTTSECPNSGVIQTNASLEDQRYGIMGYDPEEMKQYYKYIDREQYIDDLRKMCKVWGMDKLATPPVKVKKVNMSFECDGGLF